MIDLSACDSPRGELPFFANQLSREVILHVHLWTPNEPQTSLCSALQSMALSPGSYSRVDWTAVRNPLYRPDVLMKPLSLGLRPTLVWMQLQTPDIISGDLIAKMRAQCAPECLFVSWCGDIGRDPRWSHELAPHVDLMLFSSMTQVREHRAAGFKNAAYLQIGYDEDVHFEPESGAWTLPDGEQVSWSDNLYRQPRVVFLGQDYDDRTWAQWMPEHEAQLRRDVVRAFRTRELPFVAHGRGFGPELPRDESAYLYRTSRIALSLSLTSKFERYSSDRLFRALACGAVVLVKNFDDMAALGLESGDNCIGWDSPMQAVSLAEELLKPEHDETCAEIGAVGARLAREYHTWNRRMLEMSFYLNFIRDRKADASGL